MQTLIIGHKNPDMDAICSALAYAEFKALAGAQNVRAGRCGNTNERIDYALRRFGFPSPDFFSDVRPQVMDVMESGVIYAKHDEPVCEVFQRLGDQRFRGLPVVDDAGHCAGLISAYKISRHVFPALGNVEQSREVHASLESIRRTLEAEVFAGVPGPTVRNHMLVVAAMQTDSFERRLGDLDLERTVLIVGDRRNIQQIAIKAGVRAIVISGGMRMAKDLIKLAEQHGTVVLGCARDTATTVLLARSAVMARELLHDDYVALAPHLPLSEARTQVAMSAQFAFPVLDENNLLIGILSKSDFLKPVPRQLILVDHNELSQAVSGAADIPVVEILDHHRIGVASTQQPILFLNRPVGSTCSIVADCFERDGIPIPPPVAGLMMCGLISDTLNLTSPTTTDFDRALMKRLSAIAGVDPASLAGDIFSVGSPLLTLTPPQAVTADCKEYQEAGRRFSVSQLEELSFSHFEEKREALLAALETYRSSRGYDFSVMLVTDINTQNSLLLVCGSEAFTRLIDFPEAGDHIWRLDGIVSRKKQLLPYLTGLVAKCT
jgi:manganese-dependent inorganic pyrophosphatase